MQRINEKAVKDVVFDLGKVLVDWNPRYLFVRHHGMPEEQAEHFLSEVCSPSWHIELDRGRPFAQGVDLLSHEHPGHRQWIESYAQDWPRMFAGPIDSSVAQLRALHERGVRLHALSNYPAQQIRFLYERFEFMSLFYTVVISGLLRVIKPDPEAFRRLLATIGVDTCVFIDDSEENVAAAAALGIEAIHFTREAGPDRIANLIASIDD
ncbi:MAG TPA: HAD-IA family hydrolase [Gammaproteobacteria bacterium]|nr:HAD-IA family hydrolase [Gammaproteobacteria bacterium]